MTAGKVIFSLLTSLNSAKVYPNVAPQSEALPLIVYNIITNVPTNKKDGVSPLDTVRVQVSIFASTYTAACTLAASVRAALDGQRGTIGTVNVDHITFDSERDGYTEGADEYMIVQDYFLRIRYVVTT
jgi:hypothetical protein